MKNALKIFSSDLKAIFTHFFALVITLAVLVIPALYAWVNIYANWDPYGNTGNVTILLASKDRGYILEDGEYVNKGWDIIHQIAESTAIHWVIVDDADEAIDAVRAGEYYGALVMGERLSRNMYDITAALSDEEPSIIFYQNAKTNAIANKITNTAATTAERNVQIAYLSVLIENVLNEVGDLVDELDSEESIELFISMLTDLRDSLYEYSDAVGSMKIMDDSLIDRIDAAGGHISSIGVSDEALGTLTEAEGRVQSVKEATLSRVAVVSQALVELSNKVDSLSGQTLSADALAELIEIAGRVESGLQALSDSLPTRGSVSGLDLTVSTVNALLKRIQSLEEELKHLYEAGAGSVLTDAALADFNDVIGGMHSLINNDLTPGVELIFDGLSRDIRILYSIAGSVNTTVSDIQPILGATKASISALKGTVGQLQNFLNSAADATDRILQKVIEARDSEKLAELIELLNGDPQEFAEFLSQPVQVKTDTIYPVENYGSAMTPFYSTLAVWVGGVVLTAIFKTEAEEEKVRGATERQLFWGRYIIFFLLGQLQAAIIVWGDLHLLGCQCLEPGLFYLCGAVTAYVFVSLIYSLTLAFGDVGKAIVVVVMIVQIAGSSGSYPIEILPPIFSNIYLFFPFPYAINAMREAICGLYQSDIYIYLGELALFGVGGLLIGLVVRRPFVNVNRFIEEEMEKTGVL